MKIKKSILSILLAAAMTIGLTACGDSSSQTPASTGSTGSTDASAPASKADAPTDSGETVNLKMLSLPANTSGLIEGWWAEELKKDLNMTIELLPSGDQGEQKLQALMASGELPDLVVFKDYKQVENAVAGNMLLAYDDYKDLLPDMYANASNALRYSADNLSGGQGKSFTVGTAIKNTMEIRGNKEPWLRYDLYKKIGSPAIHELKDYLTVLQEMQKLEPTNADGQKVYGLSIWKDWDRSYMAMCGFAGKFVGVEYPGEGALAEIDHSKNREIRSILADDSYYLEFVRFLYEANQMGLLDPDSMTQRFDEAIGKMGAGRVLMGLGDWGCGDFGTTEKQNEGIGFQPVFTADNPTCTEGLEPIGRTWTLSVGAATKYPEAAMKFANRFFSYDEVMLRMNGPKGVMWDVNEAGKPYLTKEGYEYMQNAEKELPGGNTFGKGCPITAIGLNGTTVHPKFGVPISNAYWEKPDYAPADTKLLDMWQEDYGAEDSIDYLTKRGKENPSIGLIPFPFVAQPVYTDEIEQISARVGDVIKTNSWKMVYAKNDAEYDQLKKEMVDKAQGMGIQKFVDWYTAEYQKALEFGAKYVSE